jgi:hypothetical protein
MLNRTMLRRIGATWNLPRPDPDNWWNTVKCDARAIRSHRWLLGVVALLVAAASVWSAYSNLHGAAKFVAVLISAGVGAVLLVWGSSWIVAAVIALPRQHREAIGQRDKAQDEIQRMMEGTNWLQGERSRLNEQVAVLTKERDEARSQRDDALEQLSVLHDPTHIEGLRVKIDAMVRRGFATYEELSVGPFPTETDEEGRGIAFPIWPPDDKWDPVYEFDREARDLLREYDPGLLFAYANGVNAAGRKRRRRERQRDEAQKNLPTAEQMKNMVERFHRRPAEDLECFVNALVDVRKELHAD